MDGTRILSIPEDAPVLLLCIPEQNQASCDILLLASFADANASLMPSL